MCWWSLHWEIWSLIQIWPEFGLVSFSETWFSYRVDLSATPPPAATDMHNIRRSVPASLRRICDVSPTYKLARNANQIGTIFNHSICKYGIVGRSSCYAIHCIRRWFHTKYCIADNRRLACEVELSLTSQAGRLSMPGTDYDLALNVHMTPKRRPRYISIHYWILLLATALWGFSGPV